MAVELCSNPFLPEDGDRIANFIRHIINILLELFEQELYTPVMKRKITNSTLDPI